MGKRLGHVENLALCDRDETVHVHALAAEEDVPQALHAHEVVVDLVRREERLDFTPQRLASDFAALYARMLA